MLKASLTNHINRAFKECEITTPEFSVIYEDNKILIVCEEKPVIWFNLHSYAYFGYRKMADFTEACWKEPQQIVDLFKVVGVKFDERGDISTSVEITDTGKAGK